MGKGQSLQLMILGKLCISTCKRMKYMIRPSTKINSKWIEDLNARPETIKFQENIGEKLHDIGLSNDFTDMTAKAQAPKSKNRQPGLHQTKKFLHNKGNNQQSEKATYKMEENICKLCIR